MDECEHNQNIKKLITGDDGSKTLFCEDCLSGMAQLLVKRRLEDALDGSPTSKADKPLAQVTAALEAIKEKR